MLTVPALQAQSQHSLSGDEDIIYSSRDAEIFADIIKQYSDHKDEPIGKLIPRIGSYFIGQEYVAHTLEVADNEELVVNLRELDCTTYAENLLALARTLKSENATFEQFTEELEAIRYRDGQRKGYPSRLHYFSDWLYNNAQNNLITTPADSFGKAYPNRVDFMSTHPDSYKHLKANRDYVTLIREQEEEISGRSYYYIPKESINNYLQYLKEGDIVGITTGIKGLDIAHVGVLVEIDGNLHLMHASQSNLKVEVSDEPITSFLKPESRNTGLMIGRPVE